MKFTLSLVCILLINAVYSYPQQNGMDKDLDGHWEQFKTAHGKSYDNQFEFVRRLVWESNVKYIQKHNLEYDMGKHTYSLGMNKFGDLTFEEFKAQYLSPMPKNNRTSASTFLPLKHISLPDEVDWRKEGYVTPVKNQEQCGSCWAFSTTGSMEGQYKRKTGSLVSFSEQQLVDCSGSYGNMGCNGGLMDNGFQYIEEHGIEREEDYPYTARDGQCKYDESKVVTKCTGFTDVTSGSESDLQQAVATVGPVSVAIDASHMSFQFYKHGVYSEASCSPTQLDHGVLAIGYGTDPESGKDYWLVKNSWGGTWGLTGYIWMTRNAGNQCGIATQASYPLL